MASNDLVDQLLILEQQFDELLPLLHNKANYTEMLPVGAIQWFANNEQGSPVIPKGFLFCDGSEKSRTVYHELFEAIGTLYGEGDGSTTFNIPDWRKMFVRGYDDRDDRLLGSVQLDAMQKVTGSFGALDSAKVDGAFTTTEKSQHTYARTTTVSTTGIEFDNSLVARTDDETRPINITAIPCIKYTNSVGVNATFYTASNDLYIKGNLYVTGQVESNHPFDPSIPDKGVVLASTINVLHNTTSTSEFDIVKSDINGTLQILDNNEVKRIEFADPAIVVKTDSLTFVLSTDPLCDRLILVYQYQWMELTKGEHNQWTLTDQTIVADFINRLNEADVQLQFRTIYNNAQNSD